MRWMKVTNEINVLKDLQEYMKDKYAITGLSRYRDYYVAIGEAIGEMKSVDRIVKKNTTLEKALAMACELVPKSDWCYTKEHVCDKRGCTMCMIAYFKKKAGIEVPDNDE